MDSGQSIGVRLARRDESALEDAYATYAPSVLSYLRRYVGADEAEDVLQRTFLDVWRHAGRYDPDQRFTGWLFTIAHRRAIDTLRAQRHAVVDVDALRELVGEDGRDTVDRYADAADVREALSRLPAHEQETLHLAYFEDLTQARDRGPHRRPPGHRQGQVLPGAPAPGHADAGRPGGGGAAWLRSTRTSRPCCAAASTTPRRPPPGTTSPGARSVGPRSPRQRSGTPCSSAPPTRWPHRAARPQPQDGPLPPLAPLPRRGGRVVLLGLAAAAVLVAGLLVGLRPWQADDPAAPVAAADRSAPLEPLAGSGSGVVSMTDGGAETRMVIETHDLPALEDGQFYYAWLLDPDHQQDAAARPGRDDRPRVLRPARRPAGRLLRRRRQPRGRRRRPPALPHLGPPSQLRLTDRRGQIAPTT